MPFVDRRSKAWLPATMIVMVTSFAAASLALADARSDPAKAVSFDALYGLRDLPFHSRPVLSHAGDLLAYADAHVKPGDRPYEGVHPDKGVPVRSRNSDLFVVDLATGDRRQICPGRVRWSPVWSPDDRQIAFYAESGGAPTLWVHDLASGACRQLSPAVVKASELPGGQAIWSADGQTLYVPLDPCPEQDHRWQAYRAAFVRPVASAATDEPKVTVLRTEAPAAEPDLALENNNFFQEFNAALAAIDVTTGTVREIVSANAAVPPSLMRVSPSGSWLVYGSPYRSAEAGSLRFLSDIAAARVATGEMIPLAREMEIASLPADHDRPVYRWAPDRDQLVYLRAGQLWTVDFTTAGPGPARRLAGESGSLSGLICEVLGDGSAVLTVERSSNSAVANLVVAPFNGRPARRLTWDAATWELREAVRTADDRLWQPSSATVVLKVRDRKTGDEAYLKFNLHDGRSELLWRTRGAVQDLTASRRGDVLVGAFSDLRTPPTFYRYAADFQQARPLAVIEPKLAGVEVGPAERFETTVPLYDGRMRTLSSAVLLPPGAKRGDRLPAVVMIYPGADFSKQAQAFAGGMGNSSPNLAFTSHGYAVLLMNLPIGPEGQANDPLLEITDALLPQIQRAADLGYIDINRLALSGQSYGGYSTLGVMTRTHLFRGAIAVNGLSDLASFYGTSEIEFGRRMMEGGQFRLGAPPWSDLKRYIDNSPYLQLDKIRSPLLMIVGDEDKSLPDATKMFNGLKRLGRPAELAAYEGEGHAISEWSPVNAADASARMIQFLQATIGPGAPLSRDQPLP